MNILQGYSLLVLKDFPSDYFDSVVTDPPYGLAFMGKKWDYDVPSKELWQEVFRVLKPGGYLVSFGGTRTYHRMAVAIEDAGFEIRDQLQWLYGSGFPKSMDVSKAMDKAAGAEREVVGHQSYSAPDIRGNSYDQAHVADRERLGVAITAPATDLAKKWQGWGTALKPANEPIVLARKPLSEKTVAKNVERWGVGALNIDASRIGTDEKLSQGASDLGYHGVNKPVKTHQHTQGRWPANLLLDEVAAEMLDAQSGVSISRPHKNKTAGKSGQFNASDGEAFSPHSDSGGASRFFKVIEADEKLEALSQLEIAETLLDAGVDKSKVSLARFAYVAKASKRERNAGLGDDKCTHPTVKPIRLMEYLCNLITPPGGAILDPFAGSGTTGCAAINLGFEFIGIEREEEYVKIAENRIAFYIKNKQGA